MRSARKLFVLLSCLFFASTAATAAPRDIQIVEVDFEDQVIELFNFGPDTEDLSGWRFCSHDESITRRYSSSVGLNGVSIDPGESLFIHLLSDSGGAPNSIDRPVGNFADPFDPSAHGLQLYFVPEGFTVVNFGNGDFIADHVQWSINGADSRPASERSDEAEEGGVWTNQEAWVVTAADTEFISLAEEADGEILHGPSDYIALPEPGVFPMLFAGALGLATSRRARRR